jgi:hypothetical protein
MGLVVSDNGGGNFTPHPTGLFQMVCCDVIDLGVKETQWGPKQKIAIRWQSEEVSEKGFRLTIQQQYTRSLNEKAKLRHDLESWRGRKFTAAELKGFDLEVLIGVNAMVNVIHNEAADGKVWANVASLAPKMKNLPSIAIAADYVRQAEREPEPDEQRGSDDFDQRYAPVTDDDIPF